MLGNDFVNWLEYVKNVRVNLNDLSVVNLMKLLLPFVT